MGEGGALGGSRWSARGSEERALKDSSPRLRQVVSGRPGWGGSSPPRPPRFPGRPGRIPAPRFPSAPCRARSRGAEPEAQGDSMGIIGETHGFPRASQPSCPP